LVDRRRI
jgi:hypothetical protein